MLFVLFYRVIKVGPTGKKILVKVLKNVRDFTLQISRRNAFSSRGIAIAKILRHKCSWFIPGIVW